MSANECPFCGRRTYGEACSHHDDLPALELTLFDRLCTETDDCVADVDAHSEHCPVEAELRKVFAF